MRIVSSLFFLTMATSSAPVKLLIFGGNGFIGSHVSERLLDSGHHLTLISSKGSFSFDAVTKVRPRIARQFRCDRYNPSYCDKDLWPLLDEADSNFDAIIDFSAYRLETVQPFYERLAKSSGIDQKRPLYIYISTDSVYEVSKRFDEDRLLKETDSVRPEDEEERSRLAKGDSYGHRKLEIEEFLIDRRRNHGGLPYTILRLPDVLGERDSTDRFWKYQLWLRYGLSVKRPIQVPTFAQSLSTSYVDVKDVGAAVESILSQRPKSDDQIYNIGFPQPITLLDLLKEMKMRSEAPDRSISTSGQEGQEILSYFPSVTRGGIDVSKVQTDLEWRPSMEWRESIKRISKFYLDAESRYENEMFDAARRLMRDLGLNEEEKREFFKALRGRDVAAVDAKRRKPNDEF